MSETRRGLPEVTASGDRRASLEALRQVLARAIEAGPSPRDLAALSRQLTAVMAELDTLSAPKEVSPVDELAARRAARLAAAAGHERAVSGEQRGPGGRRARRDRGSSS